MSNRDIILIDFGCFLGYSQLGLFIVENINVKSAYTKDAYAKNIYARDANAIKYFKIY